MGFDEIVSLFEEKSAGAGGFGGKIRLDIEDEGGIVIDGSGDGVTIAVGDDEADTTIAMTLETFQGLLDGSLNPAMAFMSGKLNVGGNMGLAMKLQGMLGDD